MSFWGKIVTQQTAPCDNNTEENIFDTNENYDDAQEKLNKLRAENQKLIEAEDKHELRKKYMWRLFFLSCMWLTFTAVILLLHGVTLKENAEITGWFGCLEWINKVASFKLDDAVLIALLTTATATVLGLFAIAAAWLYPKSKENKE